MQFRFVRGVSAGVIPLLVALSAACGPPVAANDEGAGSCAARASLDGSWYLGHGGAAVLPTYGEPLGTAVMEDCEGGNGFEMEAVEIVGVSPDVAFATPDFDEQVIFVAEGTDPLPTDLKPLFHEPECDVTEPVDLRGRWLGIIGADGETEVDLVPPYDLMMRVDAASEPRYERTYLTIRVPPELGQPLTRADVQSFLLHEGDLSITATCVDGRFSATSAAASPAS